MKRLISVICILICVYPHCIFAQFPITWENSFGGSDVEVAYSIIQTTDGGYIFTGQTNSNDGQVTGYHGNTDCWVVKADIQGNIQWEKSLGGSGSDYGMSIEKTTDGGYIIGANSSSTDGQVTGNHGNSDYWIIKLDQNGNIQWQNSYGGSGQEKCFYAGQTSDGGYYAVGWTKSSDGQVTGFHGLVDYWVIRLDNTGNLIWQKTLGGSGRDYGLFAQQTTAGDFILTGASNSADGQVTGNHGDYDYWVVKIDQNGNIVWQKSLGGSGDDESSCIRQESDGTYLLTGYTASNDGQVNGNHGNADFWVVKLGPTGNIIWGNCFGGSYDENSSSINLTSDAGSIVTGFSTSNDGQVTGNHGGMDYWVIKLNSSGDLQWQQSLGGSQDDWGYSIEQTSDGGYIITGDSQSNDGQVAGNHGLDDMWTVKLSVSTGIADINSMLDFKIYPCPAQNDVYLKSDSEISDIKLLNLNNQQIIVPVISNGSVIDLDVSSLPSGVYFVSLMQKDTIITKKILIYK